MQVDDFDSQSKLSRAVGDLVIAEMFLVQATLESASVISERIGELGRHFYSSENDTPPEEPIKSVLMRTRDDVVESYSSRFSYLRKLIDESDS
jgi:hypothetical protein